jgi:hypothetical protein
MIFGHSLSGPQLSRFAFGSQILPSELLYREIVRNKTTRFGNARSQI